MHIKNTIIKKKATFLLSSQNITGRTFEEIKQELSKNQKFSSRRERNVIAGVLTKRLRKR